MNKKLGNTEQHHTTDPTLHSKLCTLHSDRRRRNGKVASLPRPQRDLVNRMLEDGVAYKEIVAALAQLGHTLSSRNISNWFQGGHQDWLLHQERLAANSIREEAVLDILTNDHDVNLPAVGLQIAATHLCQLLLACRPETADPDSGLNNYIRVANSLCRISRQLMQVQEFRDQYPGTSEAEIESLPPAKVQDSPLTPQPPSPSTFNVQGSEFDVQGSSPSSPTDEPAQPLSPSAFEVQGSKFKVQGSPAIPPSSILNPPSSILDPPPSIPLSPTNPPPPVVRSPVVRSPVLGSQQKPSATIK